MYDTPPTSLVARGQASPNANTSPSLVLDAARTFIRRPATKRRSLDNMSLYKKQQTTYASQSSDQLLQEVMRAFEDIPTKVQSYPQMRKDVKIFLEQSSDRCQRILFELSGRMKSLEGAASSTAGAAAAATSPVRDEAVATAAPSAQVGTILARLGKMEDTIYGWIRESHSGIKDTLDFMEKESQDRSCELGIRVVEKIEEAQVEDKNTNEVLIERARSQIEDLIGTVARDIIVENKTHIVTAVEALTPLAPLSDPEPVTQTYASVAAARPRRRPALHSLAVTSEDRQETAGEVFTRVEKAVDARRTGLKISKARKAKNSVIILGCDTKEEMARVKTQIESKGNGLVVEPMKNKNPLVVLKDVHAESDDDKMMSAIYNQNADIFMGLPQEQREAVVKYRKRTKNPGTSHIVLQVGPQAWQRMTAAGVLYLGLQRVRVEDQTPLIQCTKCLAFGHGRKFCTEGADRCSHCGGPHLRKDCAEYSAGSTPRCCNCSHSGLRDVGHNAFSAECQTRSKWDYLARETTAYP